MSPELGRFIQPDWYETSQEGLDTSGYASAFIDLIDDSDPVGQVGIVGGIAGAGAGIPFLAGLDVSDGELSGFTGCGGAALGGAVTDATAGLGPGASASCTLR